MATGAGYVIIPFITYGMKHSRETERVKNRLGFGGISNHMDTRLPAAEITKALTTTADKIRALAQAGYDRTEISKILGIRYQHVRNVMHSIVLPSGSPKLDLLQLDGERGDFRASQAHL
jgi:hypothetical protein